MVEQNFKDDPKLKAMWENGNMVIPGESCAMFDMCLILDSSLVGCLSLQNIEGRRCLH